MHEYDVSDGPTNLPNIDPDMNTDIFASDTCQYCTIDEYMSIPDTYNLTILNYNTSNGACVLSILTQDASEALNLIFQLAGPVLLTFNADPSFIDVSTSLEKKLKWGHLLGRIHLISPSFNA